MPGPIRWVTPTYHALHHVLTNPVSAGAYTYGKTRYERYVDEPGVVRKRTRHLPMDQWSVLLRDHHPGCIDGATFEAHQTRLDANTRPQPHQAGGAVREGSALLQGIVTCGHCGRRLHVHYRGRYATPGYHCAGKDLVEGRGVYCLNVGGTVIEQAVADAFLQAITPVAIEAMRLSVEQLQAHHDAALSQWRLEVERARYEAERAERRYRAVEPENRLVARGLESEWENRLRDLATAESELRRREQQRPSAITAEQLKVIQTLGSDIGEVWRATTTTDRDRKELLRTLLEEVILNLKRAEGRAHMTLCWRGGAFTTLNIPVPKFQPRGPRTDEDTISLLRRLAALYPDEVIAGILNRQGRKTATGRTLHRPPSRQLATLLLYPQVPTTGIAAGWRVGLPSQGGADPGNEYLFDSSLAGRWIHCRRAGHPWRALANSHHRGTALAHRPAGAARVRAHDRSYRETGRVTADGVAACKARRTGSYASSRRPA
jgi:hypothetical protein